MNVGKDRRRATLVLLALAVAVLVLVLVLARGGGSGAAVAHVGRQPIARADLDAAVEHFRLEAQRGGRPFPAADTAAGRRVRNHLLGVLVYRAELRQAARRLGVRVTRVQVLRRLPATGGEEGGSHDAFDYASAEAQLLYEGIYRKVTSGVKGRTPAQLAARRNEAMSRFVARLQRETKVRYEPGYAPGP